jgi:hypothetical protein
MTAGMAVISHLARRGCLARLSQDHRLFFLNVQ